MGEVFRGLVEVERAEVHHDQREADDEAQVAHAVGDEGLDRGVAGELLVEVEADQQIRTQADEFPEDEEE